MKRNQLLLYLVLFAVADAVIPLPILAIVLIYVTLQKPRWFADIVRDLYAEV